MYSAAFFGIASQSDFVCFNRKQSNILKHNLYLITDTQLHVILILTRADDIGHKGCYV